MEQLFKAIYFAGMVVEMIVRMPYERRRRQIPKTDRRVTRAERGLLAGLFMTMFFLPLAATLSEKKGNTA